jgi:hypothetical protein
MNKLNCDTSEYTNPLEEKVKALEKETTALKTSLATVTDTVSQLIADKAGSASLAQKVIDSAKVKAENMADDKDSAEQAIGVTIKAGGVTIDAGQITVGTMNVNTENMNFGEALEAVKNGGKIARRGWNGKGQYVFLIGGMELTGFVARNKFGDFATGALAIKTSNDVIQVGWLASQTDMLASDWYLLEEED